MGVVPEQKALRQYNHIGLAGLDQHITVLVLFLYDYVHICSCPVTLPVCHYFLLIKFLEGEERTMLWSITYTSMHLCNLVVLEHFSLRNPLSGTPWK